MAEAKAPVPRPLSPHLQVYRWSWTMAMSVVHRVTGSALYVGTALVAIWLVALASGPKAFAAAQAFFGSKLGVLILLGYTWALIHHMLGGIRHLIWDTGRGLDKVSIEIFAWATIVGSTLLTVLLWALGYWLRGAV